MKKSSYERCIELVENWGSNSVVTETDLRSLKRQFSYSSKCGASEQEKLLEVIRYMCAKYRILITREHEAKGLAWCQKVAKQGNSCKFWGDNAPYKIELFKQAVKDFKEFQFKGIDVAWQPYWAKYFFRAFIWGIGDVHYAYGSWQDGSQIQICEGGRKNEN